MNAKIISICNLVIKLSYFGLFFTTPLIFTPVNSELFEFSKMITVYLLTLIILLAWVTKMIIGRQFIFKRTFFDLPLIIFFLSQTLSTIFSHDLYMSLFGYYSRFHQGLFSITAFLILYWAFVSNIGDDSYGFRTDNNGSVEKYNIRKNPLETRLDSARQVHENQSGYINKLILTIVASSLIVAVYGLAQHFGIDAFRWVQDVQFRVFSSLGQPNWLGAYLAIILMIAIGYYLTTKSNNLILENKSLSFVLSRPSRYPPLVVTVKFITFVIFTLFAMLYTTLLFTRSRSAFTAFHVCFFILTIILFKKFRKLLLAIYLMFFILINVFNIFPTPIEKLNELTIPNIINRMYVGVNRNQSIEKNRARPSPSFEKSGEGGTESFAIRKIVWQGAWNTFKDNPIFGYGTETFALAYYRYKPREQNFVSEWDFLYNKAHNEYLNYLATTGSVGFLAYVLLITSFSVYFMRSCKKDPLNLGLFLGWTTILITNFVGFSVVVVSLFFYLIPAVMVAINNKSAPRKTQSIASQVNKQQLLLLFLLMLTTYYLLRTVIFWWLADYHFAHAQAATEQSNYSTSFAEFNTAADLSPYHPNYHSEFAVTLSEMAQYFQNQKEKSLAKNLVEKAVSESAMAIEISPNNPVFYNARALTFHNLSTIDKKYAVQAINAVLKAKELSPSDPKISYFLAIYLLNDGQIKKSLKAFEITEKLKPNYTEAIANYAKLLVDVGEKDAAVAKLEKLLKYYPGNPDIVKLIKFYRE